MTHHLGIFCYMTTFKMYGVKIKVILILTFCASSAAYQACNNSSDTAQCSYGEICGNNVCEEALYCGGDANPCGTISGLFCVSDYCQPSRCTSTGQCVHGHVCSQDRFWDRRCVYPVVTNVEEGSEFILAFKEPSTPGSYEEIEWYKGGRSSVNRAAVIHPVISDNKIQYYDDLCSGNSPCRTSERAHLNTDTGELTIFSVTLSDEGFYYYSFWTGIPDTGINYEYKLNVYVTGDVSIQGVQNDYVEVGTYLTLTCTADRIRPQPLEMYWEINGTYETGTTSVSDADGDGVFNCTSTFAYTVIKEEETIKCVVVPVYGDLVSRVNIVNPGYGPTGKSVVEASPHKTHKGETVRLTCQKPTYDGNPSCDVYTWRRQDTDDMNIETTGEIYTFIMDVPGNYTCRCANQFGESEVSDAVEITLLPDDTTGTDDVGLIAGCVVGGLVLVAMVIIAVIICKKYKINFNINVESRKDGEKNTRAVNTDNDGYEHPVTRQSRARSTANEYDEINEGAMVRPGHEGYVNVTMTTYEDIL